MENKYRDMMDRVEASQQLRMEVMKMSEQERTKKTRPMSMRVLLAAACICALLAVGVAAAEVMEFDFVKIFSHEEDGMQIDGYEVDASGVRDIPISAFSQAVQDLEEQYKDAGLHTEHLTFDSWEEAEEYLGYEIVDNSVLAPGEYIPTWRRYEEDGVTVEGNCVVDIFIGKYGISRIMVTSAIRGRSIGMHHGFTVTATISVGDQPDQTDTPGIWYGVNTDFDTMEGQESYLAANGLETVIVGTKTVPGSLPPGFDGNGKYYANFFLRGIRFKVETGYRAEDQVTALPELKQVLDAFE